MNFARRITSSTRGFSATCAAAAAAGAGFCGGSSSAAPPSSALCAAASPLSPPPTLEQRVASLERRTTQLEADDRGGAPPAKASPHAWADPYVSKVLFSEAEVAAIIEALGVSISHEYAAAIAERGEPLVVVGLLDGVFMFFSDLVRALRVEHSVGRAIARRRARYLAGRQGPPPPLTRSRSDPLLSSVPGRFHLVLELWARHRLVGQRQGDEGPQLCGRGQARPDRRRHLRLGQHARRAA